MPTELVPPVFTFGEYTLRRIQESDRELVSQWIAADPHHAGRVLPDFFLRNIDGEDSWAVEDGEGYVVFYFKTQTAVRLHIQFAPGEEKGDRDRNRKALTEGLDWLEEQLGRNRFREMCFDTPNPILSIFARRDLGFSSVKGELSRPIVASPLH
jgi:hypothetical protein